MTATEIPEQLRALLPLPPHDFHILLVLAERELYGYAIKKAVEETSQGTLSPEIGSLYRMIGRLMEQGFVEEADPRPDESPGRPRRYYRITDAGRAVLEAEALRVRNVLQLAEANKVIGS